MEEVEVLKKQLKQKDEDLANAALQIQALEEQIERMSQ